MHTIENSIFKIDIKTKGAELASVYHKPSSTEHLWNANEQWWNWHAPVLFPVIGRCLNDSTTIGEKTYPMEKHGLARHRDFAINEQSTDEIVFMLTADEDTLKIYPYSFRFFIGYKLEDNKLIQTYKVENVGNEVMYFSLGAHPAFNIPFYPNESFNDYHITFEKEEKLERHHINKDGFFDGRKSIVSLNGNINLHPALFNDDALIFKDHSSRWVEIRSRNHKQTLKVSFEGFPYLGIWTKEGAPYVCIEPWLGCADTAGKPTDFTEKEGILTLNPNEQLTTLLTIEVNS